MRTKDKILIIAKSYRIALILVVLVSLTPERVSSQGFSRENHNINYDNLIINADNTNAWSLLRLQTCTDRQWNMVNDGSLWWGFKEDKNHGGDDKGGISRMMTLIKEGRLGIGTSSPSERLHVNGNIRLGTSKPIFIKNGRNSDASLISSSSNSWLRMEANGGIAFWANGNSQSNDSPQFILRANGNLGIGTSSPSERLHVNGNIHLGTSKPILIKNGRNSDASFISSSPNSWLRMGANGGIALWANGSSQSNDSPQFILRANGSVGIGTTNLGSYKLVVEGTVGARKVKVTMDAWADFVFAEDHSLMPLKAVEHYIEKNKHLPNVPSEAQVLKEGIDLGKMDAILLRKIEELTLYILQQQKEIEALKAKQ